VTPVSRTGDSKISGAADGSAARSDGASTLDLSGRCVGSSYLLVRPIGQGATGTVWRGVDRSTGEPVAVKLLHESLLRQPKLVTRFVQERTILLMLRHRNVVRVRDLFSVGESLGLVMDLVPGGSLREHLREHRTVPGGEAARLAAQVAAALAEAHDLGVIHRDLKPDNILLQRENGRLDTRLTDFGIARVLNTPSLTTPHAVVGTPHYMAPEAFHGAPTSPAADIYALGVLLYEMVVGCPPFLSDSVADLMRRHMEDLPERRPGIPDSLWDIIVSCMEKKPRLRPSAAELVTELGDVAKATAGVPALPHPEPRPVVPEQCSHRSVPPELRPAVEHPSLGAGPRPVPHRRNEVPAWRWARPWAIGALVGGAVIASVVATSAWHISHRGGTGSTDVRVLTPIGDVGRPPQTPRAAPSLNPSAVVSAAGADRGIVPAGATAGRTATSSKAATPDRTTEPTGGGAGKAIVEARPYGPWQCRDEFKFSFTNPVLVKPCYALGDSVQVLGQMAAPSGARATLTVSLRNAATGRTVGKARSCKGLVFTDRDLTNDCGPSRLSAPHGHRYLVVLDWQYSRRGATTRGSTRSDTFTW
jgi:serine/threonine protein kinase